MDGDALCCQELYRQVLVGTRRGDPQHNAPAAFHGQPSTRLLLRQLAEQKPCARLTVEGGWCVVLRVPATRSDEDLAIELLATQGVSVHPGHFYEFASDGYLVVSLITPERIFAEGTTRLLSSM